MLASTGVGCEARLKRFVCVILLLNSSMTNTFLILSPTGDAFSRKQSGHESKYADRGGQKPVMLSGDVCCSRVLGSELGAFGPLASWCMCTSTLWSMQWLRRLEASRHASAVLFCQSSGVSRLVQSLCSLTLFSWHLFSVFNFSAATLSLILRIQRKDGKKSGSGA